MANLPYSAKDLTWLADTKETVSNFPAGAKRPIGFGLRLVQNGQTPEFAVPLRDIGPGVFELKVDSGKNTFRLVYIAKLPPGIYVLHAFMKKSKTGSAIPKEVRRTILARLQAALELSRSSRT
jgi:phage-related protein